MKVDLKFYSFLCIFAIVLAGCSTKQKEEPAGNPNFSVYRSDMSGLAFRYPSDLWYVREEGDAPRKVALFSQENNQLTLSFELEDKVCEDSEKLFMRSGRKKSLSTDVLVGKESLSGENLSTIPVALEGDLPYGLLFCYKQRSYLVRMAKPTVEELPDSMKKIVNSLTFLPNASGLWYVENPPPFAINKLKGVPNRYRSDMQGVEFSYPDDKWFAGELLSSAYDPLPRLEAYGYQSEGPLFALQLQKEACTDTVTSAQSYLEQVDALGQAKRQTIVIGSLSAELVTGYPTGTQWGTLVICQNSRLYYIYLESDNSTTQLGEQQMGILSTLAFLPKARLTLK